MHKQLILYSGGVDSWAAARRYPDAVLLYVDVGERYSHKQMQFALKHAPRPLLTASNMYLGEFEQWDEERKLQYLPARNAFFIMLAHLMATEIILLGTQGGYCLDTTPEFQERMQGLLRYLRQNDPIPPPTLTFPYATWSKNQILREYVLSGGSLADIEEKTTSCYSVHHVQCGRCKSCLQKATALHGAGHMLRRELWENHPFDREGIKALRAHLDADRYADCEADVREALSAVMAYG